MRRGLRVPFIRKYKRITPLVVNLDDISLSEPTPIPLQTQSKRSESKSKSKSPPIAIQQGTRHGTVRNPYTHPATKSGSSRTSQPASGAARRVATCTPRLAILASSALFTGVTSSVDAWQGRYQRADGKVEGWWTAVGAAGGGSCVESFGNPGGWRRGVGRLKRRPVGRSVGPVTDDR